MARRMTSSNDRLRVADSPHLKPAGSITFMCWAKMRGNPLEHFGSGRYAGLVTFAGGNAGWNLMFDTLTGQVLAARRVSGAWQFGIMPSGELLTKGVWHHCAGVWDSNTGELALYLDGQRQIASTNTAPTAYDPQGIYIGWYRNERAWNGDLAEVALFPRVLSEAELRYAATRTPRGLAGLAWYVPLWGRDSPEPDVASHQIPATVEGAPRGEAHPPLQWLPGARTSSTAILRPPMDATLLRRRADLLRTLARRARASRRALSWRSRLE